MIDADAVWERYQTALDAKPGKGAYTGDGIAALTDSVCDVPEMLHEIERLQGLAGPNERVRKQIAADLDVIADMIEKSHDTYPSPIIAGVVAGYRQAAGLVRGDNDE